jgi:hypothetical protein
MLGKSVKIIQQSAENENPKVNKNAALKAKIL